MKIKKLSINIPYFNEDATIYKILDKIKAVSLLNTIEKESIKVKDCSTDSSSQSRCRYIEHCSINGWKDSFHAVDSIFSIVSKMKI